ncbi:MAG: CDP-glucose 4,6-dehydratase [Candidatus Nanoarchaeia archaeon]|nr:CDP-glucose 4,6-dehydratase [Candidatus Nanoarchaeia archaeon]MDD5053845.1 CDP-glucose 4,6-dehydratase [Candidatus Nanoarchaeia archaeon]
MDDLKEFYNNKTVLITGHTGFKGSWMTLWLVELGAKVIGYSIDSSSEKGLFNLSGLKDKIIDIRGDIRDLNKLKEVFANYNPEIVFHLAAQSLVRKSYDEPIHTFETNIIGTANMLEAIKHCKNVKSAVLITSDKCYKNKNHVWGYRENDELGGDDPYSASKACSEMIISCCKDSFFKDSKTNIVSVRAGNVIGGGDWAEDRIIPDCVRFLEKGEKIIVRNPDSTRPWQHVLEPLQGYLLLAHSLYNDSSFSGAWNFGPSKNNIITVKELVDRFLNCWGTGSWAHNGTEHEKKHEMKLLSLDSSKAHFMLGWKPILTFDETIDFIVDWYKNYKKEDAYALALSQIKKFNELKEQRIK